MSKQEKKSSEKEKAGMPAEKGQTKSRSKGKTPKEIVKKHLADKNDIISDEDFKNMVVGEKIPDDTAHTPLDLPGNKKRPKDEDKDPEIVTPWDVISE